MLLVLLDGFSSFLGGVIGLKFKRFLSEEHLNSILIILNLTVAVIGIEGAIKMDNMALMLVSVCLGSIIGVSLDIDGKFKAMGDFFQSKFSRGDSNFSKGFITAAIVQSVGALSIIGPLEVVLKGDPTLMYLKATLDFVSSIVFASTYGAGVLFSGIVLVVYQGIIVIFAGLIKPILTEVVINQISAIGSVLLVALAFDLLELKEIKVANYLPAIFIPIVVQLISLIF